jgi:molybdenum cofactor guanylyltransferase
VPEPRATGIVLAGGRSSRMGQDKAALAFEGRTLLQRTVDALSGVADEIVIVRAPGGRLQPVESAARLVAVEDPVEGEGPLVGIAAGLAAATAPAALLVAVDMPLLRPALLRLLLRCLDAEHRWIVPVEDGRPHPLCSAIATDALPVVRAHLEAGDRAPMALAQDLGCYRMPREEWAVADRDGRSFVNVNTPEELEEAARLLRAAE